MRINDKIDSHDYDEDKQAYETLLNHRNRHPYLYAGNSLALKALIKARTRLMRTEQYIKQQGYQA